MEHREQINHKQSHSTERYGTGSNESRYHWKQGRLSGEGTEQEDNEGALTHPCSILPTSRQSTSASQSAWTSATSLSPRKCAPPSPSRHASSLLARGFYRGKGGENQIEPGRKSDAGSKPYVGPWRRRFGGHPCRWTRWGSSVLPRPAYGGCAGRRTASGAKPLYGSLAKDAVSPKGRLCGCHPKTPRERRQRTGRGRGGCAGRGADPAPSRR